MEEVRKKPISSELRNLGVGERVAFPMEQRSSVMSVISRIRKDHVRDRWKCVVKDDLKRFELIVTRTN